jgi:glycerol-3-phosphate dehydrogenase (NAD+)
MLRLCGSRVGSFLRISQLSSLHRYSSYSPLNTTAGKMAFLGGYEKKHKVTIVGSGNWYVSI